MSLGPLLKKELHWSRRHVLALAFLLLVIPLFFAGSSVVFQDIVPEDVPVAVMAEDENVSEAEVELVSESITTWTDPKPVEERAQAERLLERESVYAIVQVPAGYLDPETSANFTLAIDGTIAPFQSPSELVQDLIEFELEAAGFENVGVERETIGEEKGLEEYLYPSFILGLIIFFAFTYVPYTLRRERPVLDRLRVESSLEAVITAKLVSFTALMLVPLAVFHAVGYHYGYGVETAMPWAILVLLVTFLVLSLVSATIMVLSQFRGVGQFVNLVVMLGLFAFSGLVFPLGFFSPVRTALAEVLPTYYATVTVRSLMLKGSDVTTFLDWIGMLVVTGFVAAVALKLSIVHYRRRQ